MHEFRSTLVGGDRRQPLVPKVARVRSTEGSEGGLAGIAIRREESRRNLKPEYLRSESRPHSPWASRSCGLSANDL